jgi:hypothetical protein
LSTLHFQAPGFYLKQGWEVAARIECEPPGHTRFYMNYSPVSDSTYYYLNGCGNETASDLHLLIDDRGDR